MDKKFSPGFVGFLQATGLVTYLCLLSLFFTFVTPNFSKTTAAFYQPIVILLIFVLSAVVTSMTVLGRAGFLFWEKRYKEAITLIGWTVGWIFLYVFVFMMLIV